MFSQGPFHFSDDAIGLRHLVKKDINSRVGLDVSLKR